MVIIFIVIGLLLDRITKLWTLKTLANGNDIVIIKDFFSLQYVENRGAAFGIFQGKVVLLAIVTFFVIAGMIYYLYKEGANSRIMTISFSLIISGALGNLYDRVFYKYVVDFALLHYKEVYYFPNFNIADVLVVCGTILLAFYILKEGK